MKLRMLVGIALLGLSGCATTAIDPTAIYWGNPPAEENALPEIKALFQTRLRDPESARYRIESTYRGYCKKGALSGGGVGWAGWAVNVWVNGTNAFGGYTGEQPYTVLFSFGHADRAIEGLNFGGYGPSSGSIGLGGGAGVCSLYNG